MGQQGIWGLRRHSHPLAAQLHVRSEGAFQSRRFAEIVKIIPQERLQLLAREFQGRISCPRIIQGKLSMRPRPAESLMDLHERRLDWLKVMVHGGSAIAIPAAIQYCSKNDLIAPQWLVQITAIHYPTLLRTNAAKKRGRSVSLVDRYRQDMKDYARWSEVKTVREKQIEIREEVDFLRANPKKAPAGRLEDREKMLKWVGKSLRRAFDCASMLLA